MSQAITPRIIRLRDAPFYLGMKKDHFNASVRSLLPEIEIGQRGIGFDRVDLDIWVEHHKRLKSGSTHYLGDNVWESNEQLDSTIVEGSGILTKKFSEDAFARALVKVRLKRRNNS